MNEPGPLDSNLPGPGDSNAAEAAVLIRERSDVTPAVALVLGSGLGEAVAQDVRTESEFDFSSLPGFPPPTVPGHAGLLAMGELYGVPAAVFRGRVHYYEGHGVASITLIPRVAASLGARTLILTNAAGGLDRSMRVGQLMLIEDHINFLGVNPLMGWTFPDGQPAFVDQSDLYERGLRALAKQAAVRAGIDVAHGVYVGLPGPSYETRAETAFLRAAGGDAVGMSTVSEAMAAAALGMRVLGISLISNVAGMASNHEEVLEAGKRAAGDLRAILSFIIPKIAELGLMNEDAGQPAEGAVGAGGLVPPAVVENG